MPAQTTMKSSDPTSVSAHPPCPPAQTTAIPTPTTNHSLSPSQTHQESRIITEQWPKLWTSPTDVLLSSLSLSLRNSLNTSNGSHSAITIYPSYPIISPSSVTLYDISTYVVITWRSFLKCSLECHPWKY
ncbi:hypothetical protein PGTUg99_031554 [Puccinia graminis f. sp. tritici]|uniref:Uncharacterized protein n=1 Tax=Puccinia graminis f. sp. tritici TaxID=56615 RepID=A0A5B0SJH6_PUCGR|nr:hypothetical protein PGTUg99_031554 [Puccinia graminis f. sp. tritici]